MKEQAPLTLGERELLAGAFDLWITAVEDPRPKAARVAEAREAKLSRVLRDHYPGLHFGFCGDVFTVNDATPDGEITRLAVVNLGS